MLFSNASISLKLIFVTWSSYETNTYPSIFLQRRIQYVLGKLGHYFFTVASGSKEINYDQMCYNWMRDELKRISTVRSYWRLTLTCPCDFRLAMADGRWKFDVKQFNATEGQRQCIYQRIPWGFSTQVQTIIGKDALTWTKLLTLLNDILPYLFDANVFFSSLPIESATKRTYICK